MRVAWGCEKRTLMAIPCHEEIEDGVYKRYWNCPRRFIPKSVFGFMAIYKYHKDDFPSAPMPALGEISLRFLVAAQYLDAKFSEYHQQEIADASRRSAVSRGPPPGRHK